MAEHEYYLMQGNSISRINKNCLLTLHTIYLKCNYSIDYETLTDTSANGYVKTVCPSIGSYEKICNGKTWIWAFSGKRIASFNDWNSQSGEPNGNTEHCVALWLKGDYR